MKPFALLVIFAFAISAHAQQVLPIVLKSGQRVETFGVRRDGDTIMGRIRVGASGGEIGYQVSTIEKVEFPEPKALKPAADELAQGQFDKALSDIEPVVKYYEPFKDIPGAWWAAAALIKVQALAALKRDGDAESLAAEIQKNATDPESARAAALKTVNGLVRKQEFEKAAQVCDDAIKQSTRADVLGEAWIRKGDVLFAQKQWDGALLAYLHVPVFHSGEKLLMPSALLGSARSYRRLNDNDRAKRTLKELTAAFPKSAEATLAQAEIQKLQ
jgi:TolA-binding protein